MSEDKVMMDCEKRSNYSEDEWILRWIEDYDMHELIKMVEVEAVLTNKDTKDTVRVAEIQAKKLFLDAKQHFAKAIRDLRMAMVLKIKSEVVKNKRISEGK